MKKLTTLLALFLSAIAFYSCSQDSIPLSGANNTVNTDYSGSKVLVNNVKYVPTTISVLDQPTTNIARKKKTFFFTKDDNQSFSVQFNYATEDIISNTYSLNTKLIDHAFFTFFESGFAFDPISGSVKITEFADNQYRIEFIDIVVENPDYKVATTEPETTEPETGLEDENPNTTPAVEEPVATNTNNEEPVDTTIDPVVTVVDPDPAVDPDTVIPTLTASEIQKAFSDYYASLLDVDPETGEATPTDINPVIESIIKDPTKRFITGTFQAEFILK